MYYFCIAHGMADCTPDSQDYYAVASVAELFDTVDNACAEFDREELEGQENGEPYKYNIRTYVPATMPETTNNWSCRVRVARGTDYVLDVIGMTADEYEREQGE
jgi:hypothetical protein